MNEVLSYGLVLTVSLLIFLVTFTRVVDPTLIDISEKLRQKRLEIFANEVSSSIYSALQEGSVQKTIYSPGVELRVERTLNGSVIEYKSGDYNVTISYPFIVLVDKTELGKGLVNLHVSSLNGTVNILFGEMDG